MTRHTEQVLHLVPFLGVELDPSCPKSLVDLFQRELVEHPSADPEGWSLTIRYTDDEVPRIAEESLGGTAIIEPGGSMCIADRSRRFCRFSVNSAARQATVEVGRSGFSELTLLNNFVVPMSLVAASEHDFAPVHASGFMLADSGKSVVASAWSGVGKTNLVLQARKAGLGAFFGDDMVLVDGFGNALQSPRQISAFVYNEDLLQESERRTDFTAKLGRRLDTLTRRDLSPRLHMIGRIAVSRFGHTPVPARPNNSLDTSFVNQHIVLRAKRGSSNRLSPVEERSSLAQVHAPMLTLEYASIFNMAAAMAWEGGEFARLWTTCTAKWEDTLSRYFRAVEDVRILEFDPSTGPVSLESIQEIVDNGSGRP